MSYRSRSPALALLLLATACQPASDHKGLDGCYDVVLGPWRVEPLQEGMIPSRWMPSDSDPGGLSALPSRLHFAWRVGERDAAPKLEVAVPDNVLPVRHRISASVTLTGTLDLMLTTGYAGTSTSLTPDGDAWVGTLRTFSDLMGIQDHERDVRLTPADCATEPREPSTLLRPLPTELQLVDGPTIALGEPLPAGLERYPRVGSVPGIRARTAGVFAGADSVLVLDFGGPVRTIVFRIPPAVGWEPLIARVEAEWGAPDERSDRHATWTSRLTMLTLTRRDAGWSEVTLQDLRTEPW